MIQEFFRQQGHSKLYLFFAGWAMDANPFRSYFPSDGDIMLCYNYTSLDFDASVVTRYDEIHVEAFSFGVWVAAHTLAQIPNLTLSSAQAYNGTLHPIDNVRGIPEDIFNRTLQNLSAENLDRFNRRICGSAGLKKQFDAVRPHRELDDVTQELKALGIHCTSHPTPKNCYTKAYIGERDLIFPIAHQQLAWQDTPIVMTEEAHFPARFLTPHLAQKDCL